MKVNLKAAKPEILFIGGVVGVGLGVYFTRKAAKNEEPIKHNADEAREHIVEYMEDLDSKDDISEEERKNEIKSCKRDLMKVTRNEFLGYLKIYWKAAVCLGGGLVCFGASHHGLRKELSKTSAQLLAAWSFMDDLYSRMKNELGPEKARDLYYDLKDETIEVEEENGKKSKKKVKVIKEGMFSPSPYSMFFDGSSREWKPDPEYNKLVLTNAQEHFNHIYERDKVVTLYQIVEHLDLMEAKDIPLQYHLVGWHKDRELNDCIDFGLCDTNSVAVRRFMNGYEPVVLLDFNCYDISGFMPSLTFLK